MNPLSRLRRHHAIEHATVAVLLERRGRPTNVYGLSDFGGFSLRGDFTREEVEAAAGEAIERLRSGDVHLAITNNCGTNLVVNGVLTATAALLAARGRRDGLQAALTAATLAGMAAVPAGRWVQRNLTTTTHIDGLRIESVRRYGGGGRPRFRVAIREG